MAVGRRKRPEREGFLPRRFEVWDRERGRPLFGWHGVGWWSTVLGSEDSVGLDGTGFAGRIRHTCGASSLMDARASSDSTDAHTPKHELDDNQISLWAPEAL